MRENTTNVAIYWDFENLQASLVEKKGGSGAYGRTKYQAQEALIDIESIMEYAATFGVVSINRAYCNWQWYSKYRESLLHNGLELIQLFHPGASAKNGGDIKLCLDCTEDLMRFPHVEVVVIVGGDSDYLPLAQKVKAMGKTLVGIGTQANTNRHWAHSCHEFKFYEALILDDAKMAAHTAPSQTAPTPAASVGVATPVVQAVDPDNVVLSKPEELLCRAIVRLSGKFSDGWVLKGAIRPMMKRLDPTFEEEQHGVKNFSAFMKKFESLLEVRAGRNDQEVRLKGLADRTGAKVEASGERPEDRRGPREERRDDRHRERRTEVSKAAPTDGASVLGAETLALEAIEEVPVVVISEPVESVQVAPSQDEEAPRPDRDEVDPKSRAEKKSGSKKPGGKADSGKIGKESKKSVESSRKPRPKAAAKKA